MYDTIAELYDSEFRSFAEDIPFYLSFLRKESRILELGSGTGRLSIPLAKEEHWVTGIEHSKSMLQIAERKTKALPLAGQKRLDFIRADFLSLDFPEPFDAVLAPFSALNFVIDAACQEDLFRSLARHLKPEGILIADARFEKKPPPPLERKSEKRFSHQERGTLIVKHTEEHFDPARHLLTVHQIYEEKDYWTGKAIKKWDHELKLYLFPHEELVGRLESAGFFVREVLGDYDQSKFDAAVSPRMLVVCSVIPAEAGIQGLFNDTGPPLSRG